jgi:hypothetical protein
MQKTFVLASILLMGACVSNAESPNTSSTDQEVRSANRIALNRIALNRIALNRIALNRIALNRIALNGLRTLGVPGATDIMDTADGRDVFKYLVQCALTDSQSVTFNDADGNEYTYTGAIGLAPEWDTGFPTDSEKHWVSACLLARTNAYGIPVAISLRGDNPALTVDAVEAAAYSLHEAAFWGDVFGDTFVAVACPGPLKLANSQLSTMPLRACAVSADGVTTTCGHQYAGPCESVCVDSNGLYTECAGVHEVVNTYLATP